MSNFPMSARNHSYYQDLLEQHISGELLSPDSRLSLFDHIEDCDACRQILEAETRITARMKSVPRLVAPSDLRSKILSQAVRDHRERTTTPSEDPTVSDLLKAPSIVADEREQKSQANAANEQQKESSKPSRPSDSPRRNLTEDFPVFAGVARPSPSRLRRTWRRASPMLATAFLVVAGLGALYSGQFQGIPVAGEAQGLLLAAVDAVMQPSNTDSTAARDSVDVAGFTHQTEPVFVADSAMKPTISSPSHSITLSSPPEAAALEEKPRLTEQQLPGTQAVVSMMRQMRTWSAAADSTVAALSAAASEPVPAPAENASPQIAALVLKATDRDKSVGGFRDSELAEALEAITRTQPGGRIARQDQFAMDGHRYRLYTLDLPAGCTTQMVETLTPYQTPADGVIVNALISQDSVNTSRGGAVQFYSSNEARLRSALQTIQPVSSHGASERIRVVVVE